MRPIGGVVLVRATPQGLAIVRGDGAGSSVTCEQSCAPRPGRSSDVPQGIPRDARGRRAHRCHVGSGPCAVHASLRSPPAQTGASRRLGPLPTSHLTHKENPPTSWKPAAPPWSGLTEDPALQLPQRRKMEILFADPARPVPGGARPDHRRHRAAAPSWATCTAATSCTRGSSPSTC